MSTDAHGYRWDRPIALWRQRGTVFLWRYQDNAENYPGWHCTADAEGCESLLRLFAVLRTAEPGDGRTVRLTSPTAAVLSVPNNRGGAARWFAPAKWTLERASTAGPGDCRFETDDDRLRLVVSDDTLNRLTELVRDLVDGIDDYSIKLCGESLWGWRFNGEAS
ncbi:hypothetical protein [Alienimonas chondri]|uniref:Uncharacterized protein n=1 Tax=Alienimonas chondri TaxID=2681879 RepID=A0ABX1VFR5_9PLAN|nr:hypothetical protein [Alienimonas chondri]NNJ26102.1 hypothetical protein [Alienimonas chondri]